MLTYLEALLESRRGRHDERGLALLDVLIAMAIFSIISMLAVVSLGRMREQAGTTASSPEPSAPVSGGDPYLRDTSDVSPSYGETSILPFIALGLLIVGVLAGAVFLITSFNRKASESKCKRKASPDGSNGDSTYTGLDPSDHHSWDAYGDSGSSDGGGGD